MQLMLNKKRKNKQTKERKKESKKEKKKNEKFIEYCIRKMNGICSLLKMV